MSTPTNTVVSVVIPHRGSDTALERCIQALRSQNYPQSLVEIVVVLNEPKERGLEFPLSPGVSLLWEPNNFSYAARNRGVRHATSDVIAFTDSDVVPNRDWINQGVSAISRGADIVAGHIDLSFTTTPLSPAACYEKLYAFDQQKNTVAGYAATANLFVTRQALERWGLFDETSRSGEDFEWTRRATEAGARLVYSPKAKVTHPARESMAELFAKARRTTALFVGPRYSFGRSQDVLTSRAAHHLFTPPSPSKESAMTYRGRSLALVVRILLVCYKALCLLGLSPTFRKEQKALQRKVLSGFPKEKITQ
jgi:GT2 family glycosyltransferase